MERSITCSAPWMKWCFPIDSGYRLAVCGRIRISTSMIHKRRFAVCFKFKWSRPHTAQAICLSHPRSQSLLFRGVGDHFVDSNGYLGRDSDWNLGVTIRSDFVACLFLSNRTPTRSLQCSGSRWNKLQLQSSKAIPPWLHAVYAFLQFRPNFISSFRSSSFLSFHSVTSFSSRWYFIPFPWCLCFQLNTRAFQSL